MNSHLACQLTPANKRVWVQRTTRIPPFQLIYYWVGSFILYNRTYEIARQCSDYLGNVVVANSTKKVIAISHRVIIVVRREDLPNLLETIGTDFSSGPLRDSRPQTHIVNAHGGSL